MHLTDWPEISSANAAQLERSLGTALRLEIHRKLQAGTPIPLPRSKPSKGVNVHLSASESLKVLVHNEIVKSEMPLEALAGSLGMPAPALRRALALDQPLDMELLSTMVAAFGKRLVAYIY